MEAAKRLVLLVEDDVDSRELMETVLATAGFDVIAVQHSGAALTHLESASALPAAILLDIMTPTMDGWEFLRRRGADRLLATIPVIVLSAHPGHEHAVSLGAAAVLQKPVHPVALIELVEAITKATAA